MSIYVKKSLGVSTLLPDNSYNFVTFGRSDIEMHLNQRMVTLHLVCTNIKMNVHDTSSRCNFLIS